MNRRKLLMTVMLSTACIYFVFNLEFIALVITTATMLVFVSREENAVLHDKINHLQEQITELKIDSEVSALDLIKQNNNQQDISIDEKILIEIEAAFKAEPQFLKAA